MATFICNTCNFFTKDSPSLKVHYLSEWHRYNLKRKTAELPPVSIENFEKRVALTKQKELQASVKNHFKCPYSGKVFKSEGAWNTFKKSKKFRELEAKQNKGPIAPLKPEPKEKKQIWKTGDSPQKRWMYKMYLAAADEDDENWEDVSEETSTHSMSDSEEEEEAEDPFEVYGESPITLEKLPP